MSSSWTHRPALSEGPRPRSGQGTLRNLLLRTETNLPIRVPTQEWTAVSTGAKTMFRAYNGRAGKTRTLPVIKPEVKCPRPCLLYAKRFQGYRGDEYRWDAIPGVLLSHRQEPLGSMSSDDLAREGFEFMAGFRFHWKRRHPTVGWRPWDMISVLEVCPMPLDSAEERETWGKWLFEQLYGEWL